MVLEAESNCNCTEGKGEKGTTIWFSEDITLPSFGNNHVWKFTDTKPKCYCENSGCLVNYEIATNDNSLTAVIIGRSLNNQDCGSTVHSFYAGNNVAETFDVSQVRDSNNVLVYQDGGP